MSYDLELFLKFLAPIQSWREQTISNFLQGLAADSGSCSPWCRNHILEALYLPDFQAHMLVTCMYGLSLALFPAIS